MSNRIKWRSCTYTRKQAFHLAIAKINHWECQYPLECQVFIFRLAAINNDRGIILI